MDREMQYTLVLWVLALLFMATFYLMLNNMGPFERPKLPPGSLGWPFLGETLRLYSQSPCVFFGTRHQRYGDIFKTHIHSSPCVMLSSPEAVRFVLVTHSHLFKPIYPRSKQRLIGPWAIFFNEGDFHSRMRKIVQGSLSLDVIRKSVTAVESAALSTLDSCCSRQTTNTFHQLKNYSFEVAVLSIFGGLDSSYKEKLRENFFILDHGYNCFAINLPGTPFRRALLARRRLGEILSEIISERREKRFTEKNLLSTLLNYQDQENGKIMTVDQIADNIMGVLFAAQDTTASVLTWIVKYIHDHPQVLEAIKVRVEQKDIFESNDRGRKPITWAQTRSMPYTSKVVMESLRMASIISYTYREAAEDVIYNGMLIPKGWKVMPLFRMIHHNADFFSDPEKFDPSRFEVAPKPNTFTPFGNGVHSCPGNEVAKLEILIFIHHLVNKYRCEVVTSESGVEYCPFLVPKKGLPAKFTKIE